MLNWGIIGFGRMGNQYANCFKKESNIFRLIGISSKTKNIENNIFFFKSYDDLFQSNEIDAVYISTLNITNI